MVRGSGIGIYRGPGCFLAKLRDKDILLVPLWSERDQQPSGLLGESHIYPGGLSLNVPSTALVGR